ncbi:MAG: DUF4240 domain-containing protein, partial [Actinobacteria bacterium]|nr:DUF4240 domain-containing protein [Actinomycetota bacterium]
LYELDRESLAEQPVRFGDDPPGSEPLPLSDDGFLYLRAGIVTRGRETYEAVLADPTLLAAGEWEECEELLYVAEEVAGDDIERIRQSTETLMGASQTFSQKLYEQAAAESYSDIKPPSDEDVVDAEIVDEDKSA